MRLTSASSRHAPLAALAPRAAEAQAVSAGREAFRANGAADASIRLLACGSLTLASG